MGNLLVNSNRQALADRAHDLTVTVNQLIADIESDLKAPEEAAFHAKAAFKALNGAHNALLEAITANTRGHYEGMAIAAQQAAA